jgi:Carboxypeptidase regulatory-like domain/TonB dependent receptor-like, beta-barrel
MRRSLAFLGALALCTFAAATSFGQSTTGSIVGTVTDETAAALPGVTVTIKGEAIVGTQTDVTNEKGFFRFVALPPGAYAMSFSLSGFATLNRPGVKVSVGGTNEENVGLKVSKMAEEVTVTGEAEVVDTTSNQVSTNYDKDWVRNAPIPRFTFFDLINAAPGVNQAVAGDSRSTSLGSSSSDNSYMLDGTDFTAPLTGSAWPWPNTDAIEEIEVLSLGAPAEYGNFQGAVFNVVTRQGSNSFHGDANFYLQTQGLTGRNTTEAEDGGLPYHRDKFNDATFQLSGPIVKDKLWFFGSYQYQRDFQSPVGIPVEFPNKFAADRVFGKINWQIDAKNKLMFAYHDDYYRIPCIDNDCNEFTDPSTIKVEHGHNPSPNVTYTSVLSDKTYVEARVSGFYGKDHADPLQPSEPRVKTRFLDLDTGQVTGGIYSWYDGNVWKTAASAKVSHFADSFLGGSHDFKFGVQFNDGGGDYVGGYNDYVRTYGGVPAYGYGYQTPAHSAGKTRGVGVYFDDTFRVNSRLTLNLGARYDYNNASFGSYPILDVDGNETGQRSPAVPNLFSWNTVSPRIGFNLKLTGDGKTVFKAHYGRYYRGVITGEFDDIAPSAPVLIAFSGEYNADGSRVDPEVVQDNSQLKLDPNYKAPYTDQYIVGLDREIVKDLGLSLNYVYKKSKNMGGYVDSTGVYTPVTYSDTEGLGATGKDITVYRLDSDPADSIFLLTNVPQLHSTFSGLTVQLTKHMSHNWEMVGSLVVSKNTGRTPSSLGGPIEEPTSAVITTGRKFGRNPNDFINTDGRIISDRPVTGKVQFVYMLPRGFLLGLNYTHQEGRPYGRLIQLSPDLVTLPTQILGEPIDGSRRVGTWNTFDVRAQKEFHFSERAGVAVFVDALNLTNNAAYDGVASRLGTSDTFGQPTDFILPRRFMVGAKLTF